MQLWNVVLSITAVIVSVIVAVVQRRRKRLYYSVRSVPLISVRNDIEPEVEILFRGKLVSDVRLIELTVRNGGNVPIDAADFVEPLIIGLHKQARVMSTDILRTEPDNLRVDISVSEESDIVVQPMLLNPGDRFTAKFLIAGGGVSRPSARIRGVKRLEPEGGPSVYTLVILILVWLVASYLWGFYARRVGGLLEMSPIAVLALGFVVLASSGILVIRRVLRSWRMAG